MWIGSTTKDGLALAKRWNVEFFSYEQDAILSCYNLRRLGDIVDEQKMTQDPQTLPLEIVNYLGLENVRSLTGECVDFYPKPAKQIKSRSKKFDVGDVLFGRLRPELNKVILADKRISPGLCSNEFIVLRAREEEIRPLFLRYILASEYVSRFARKLRSGASLPRMNAKDLIEIEVPVPPLEVQDTLVEHLVAIDRALQKLRGAVEALPQATLDALMKSMSDSDKELKDLSTTFSKFTQ